MIRIFTVTCLALGWSSTALAQTASPALVDVLGYVDVPLSHATLTRVGADASVLATLARDDARLPYVRMRAAASLAFFSGPESERALTELALDPQIDREVRICAISALSYLATPGVEDPLASVLASSAETAVREASVRAIGRLGIERAQPVLQGVIERLAPSDPMRTRVRATLDALARR